MVLLSSCGAKTTMLKEIPFVPSYNAGMTLQTYTPPEKNNGSPSATYLIKNTTNKDVLDNYTKILKNNGWTISQNPSPSSIIAKKDNHSVVLLAVQISKDVQLTFLSK